ncbi:MAG TPA: 4-(cytidine 5'-diphospho)-2-C-methyl-D-erythritol kinase [Bryobacteraceae bacterium]|nr:4-(cytidine 5'-diphospho)-2-C-methyl-D-erythritol kinase [Bryobacteraceae bacterium]
MSTRLHLRTPAKINLDLRVLHKRPDNFHELRTVFQTISLADTLEIEYRPSPRTHLELDDPLAIPDNLVLRAARSVLDALKLHAQIRFRLNKKIPMGAGLGGGSSNAAAVLLALPALARRPLQPDLLLNLASDLGSDVPFFLTGGTALALGRGTELYPLPDTAQDPMLLVAPGIHVSTPAAYQALGLSLTSPDASRKMNGFQLFVRTLCDLRSARAASTLSANDFESAVFSQHPQLKKMWSRLRKHAAGARMTGSGSALFALFESSAERDLAEKVLEGDPVMKGCRVMPARLVSGASYRRMWRRQLAEAGLPDDLLWPLPSRHAR